MKRLEKYISYKILNDDYNNSTEYNEEKQCESTKYLYYGAKAFDLFKQNEAFYNIMIESFSNSKIANARTKIELMRKKDPKFYDDNTMLVEVEITKKGFKSKSIKIQELKLSDHAINYFYVTDKLRVYNDYIREYKQTKESGILNISFGKSRSSIYDKENMLLANCLRLNNICVELLKRNPTDKQLLLECKKWLRILEKQAPVNVYNFDHGVSCQLVEEVIPFSEKQLEILDNLIQMFDNRNKLEKSQKKINNDWEKE